MRRVLLLLWALGFSAMRCVALRRSFVRRVAEIKITSVYISDPIIQTKHSTHTHTHKRDLKLAYVLSVFRNENQRSESEAPLFISVSLARSPKQRTFQTGNEKLKKRERREARNKKRRGRARIVVFPWRLSSRCC